MDAKILILEIKVILNWQKPSVEKIICDWKSILNIHTNK